MCGMCVYVVCEMRMSPRVCPDAHQPDQKLTGPVAAPGFRSQSGSGRGACPEPQRPLLADSARALELFTREKPSLPGWLPHPT